MKKIYALLFVGSLLATLGLLGRFYAYPALAVVPADLDSSVVAESPGGEPATYFSIPDLAEVDAELTSTTVARVDPELTEDARDELGRDDVLVVRTYACTDLASVTCAEQPLPISGAISTLALDVGTGLPVAWDGASIETGGATETGVDFEGLTIKFPFDTQRQTYEFWNADLRTTVPVEFVGETDVDGLAAYEFRGEVAPTVTAQIDVPGDLVGRTEPTVEVDRVASSRTTYVVEPETGVILSATSVLDSHATLDGERVLTLTDGTFTTPNDKIADSVATYKPLATALFALRVVVPIVAPAVGLLLVAAGLLLLARRRRGTPPSHGAAPSDGAAPAAAGRRRERTLTGAGSA